MLSIRNGGLVKLQSSQKYLHPWKINGWVPCPKMEVWWIDHVPFLFMGDGCRFQPFIFQGVSPFRFHLCVEKGLIIFTEIEPSSIRKNTPENSSRFTKKNYPIGKGRAHHVPDLHLGGQNVNFWGCGRFIQSTDGLFPLHWNRQRLDSPGRKPPLVILHGSW